MPNDVGSGRAVCPFYSREGKLEIVCEGFFERTAAVIRFQNGADKRAFQQKHCETYHYDSVCPVAEKLMEKYRK